MPLTSRETPNPENLKSTVEYFAALERWLQEAYMWQCMNTWFPYMLLSQQAAAAAAVSQSHSTQAQVLNQDSQRLPQNLRNVPQNQQAAAGILLLGVEHKIPPLWKRFTAEFLDFLILFSLKLVITLLAVDIFELIDLDKYDLDILQSSSKMDYQMALQMTTEILILEVVHRVVVCIYEAICLYQGSDGRVGGATPGKSTMGLRVILCDRVIPGANQHTVFVYPATDLGFPVALWRSFVKNMVIAFFFPVCLSMFLFQHNRAAYDVFCRTIVIEDPQPRPQPFGQRQ